MELGCAGEAEPSFLDVFQDLKKRQLDRTRLDRVAFRLAYVLVDEHAVHPARRLPQAEAGPRAGAGRKAVEEVLDAALVLLVRQQGDLGKGPAGKDEQQEEEQDVIDANADLVIDNIDRKGG